MESGRILGNNAHLDTEETAMYHLSSYHLAQARAADLRRHAHRDTLARAARGPAGRRRPALRWVRRPRAVPHCAQAGQPALAGEAQAR